MDLSRPKGREMFLRLVAISDAFIENNAAGVMDKLGIGWEACRAVNPRFVMISMPGFGQTGPYRHFKGYGGNTEAVVGHTGLRGYADMDYNGATRSLHSDAAGGASAAFAILSALHYARRTGKGQFIEMSQSENVSQHLTQAIMDYSMNGRSQATLGNRDPSMAPHGVYRCAGPDKWVAIAVASDAEWQAMCRVMGQPELAADERFADGLSRYQHQDELDAIVSGWTASRGHYEVMHALQAVGVSAAAVLNQQEVFEDPHLQARGLFEVVDSPSTGMHRYLGPAYKLSKTPLHIRSAAPTLGQHNEHVYKELLKVSDAEYEELVREQHIGDTYIELLRDRQPVG